MPFAELPSSRGFVAPTAPDWGQFGLAAIQAINNAPHYNTADAINQAVAQIDDILKLQSPEAKLQRALHMQQLAFQQHIYEDYQAHPERYLVTANGPVLRDPEAMLDRQAKRAKDTADAKYSIARANNLASNDNTSQTIAGLLQAAQAVRAGKAPSRKVDNDVTTQEAIPGSTAYSGPNYEELQDSLGNRQDADDAAEHASELGGGDAGITPYD